MEINELPLSPESTADISHILVGSLRGSHVHNLHRLVANVYKDAAQFQFREPTIEARNWTREPERAVDANNKDERSSSSGGGGVAAAASLVGTTDGYETGE